MRLAMFLSLVFTFLVPSSPSWAKVKLVTTLPDLAWAAREIGKDHVDVQSLLTGTEDPHYIDAVPSFIRLVANADVVCFVGLDLEVGWLPKVLSRSGNSKVQKGGKGYCETGMGVDALDKPTGPVNRSMGDTHPAGNPHYWLSPLALASGAKIISDQLIEIDPVHASAYQVGWEKLKSRLQTLVETNRAKLKKALGTSINQPVLIEYHKEFSYLLSVYGLKSFGTIEEKPGVPPSAGRIAQVSQSARSAKLRAAIASSHNSKSALESFKEISGIPYVLLPTSVQTEGKIKDYVELQNHLVNSIIATISGKP